MPPVPIRDGLFTLEGEALRLVGGYSPSADRYHFPLAPVCPYTGADDIEQVTLPAHGRLWSWTAVNAAPPGYAGPVPYGFGVVELENGLRVIGRLTISDPEGLTEGQRMRLVPEAIGADEEGHEVVTWAFTPDDGGAND